MNTEWLIDLQDILLVFFLYFETIIIVDRTSGRYRSQTGSHGGTSSESKAETVALEKEHVLLSFILGKAQGQGMNRQRVLD